MGAIDITGQRFSRLLVLRRVENDQFNNACWECKCDCGNTVIVTGSSLRRGHTKSCGCLQKEKAAMVMSETMSRHHKTDHPLFIIWGSIIKRCENPNCKAYKNYGGRGITICDEWRNSFERFYQDLIDGYSPGLELDRIDNSKGYYKENCRWTTTKENCRNKRNNHLVETEWGKITIAELTERLYGPNYTRTNYCKIYKQIKRGWSIEKICQEFYNNKEAIDGI